MRRIVLILPIYFMACDRILPISGQDAAEGEIIGTATLHFFQQSGHKNAARLFNVRPRRREIIVHVFTNLSKSEYDALELALLNAKKENKIEKNVIIIVENQ